MSYPAQYLSALEFTMNAEDGPKWRTAPRITHDPKDPGGLTKFGISQRAFPKFDIANLTPGEAEGIYFNNYWLSAECAKLPAHLAPMVFDMSVNCGHTAAARCLQGAVGVKADGKVGPATLAATKAVPARVAVTNFTIERLHHYSMLKDSLKSRFGRGWINRALAQMHDIERRFSL